MFEALSKSIHYCMRPYWGWEKTTVYDLACHATSFTKLQIGLHKADASSHQDNTDDLCVNTEYRGCKVSNTSFNSLFLIQSSHNHALFYRSGSPLIAMPIWQQQPQRVPHLFSPPILKMSIINAQFCRLCLASSHPTTKFSVIPPQPWATLINTRPSDRYSIVRRPR